MDGDRDARRNGRPDRHTIRKMFARIAPRYDLLNRLLSGWTDQRWRRRAVEAALRGHDGGIMKVLDTCAGTGDLGIAFARRLGPDARVFGCDFTQEMLTRFARKAAEARLESPPRIAAGDSLALPFRDETFDIVSSAFGVRNVAVGSEGGVRPALVAAFREMRRVLLPRGKAVILEFSRPHGGWAAPAMNLYFRKVLPVIGNLIAGKGETAYGYLPLSVKGFPEGEELMSLLEQAGFRALSAVPLTARIATLYLAERTGPAPEQRREASHGVR
ncbi:MAG: ubiquinone/menaquinone biosynthesis methyltransferase [Planctomycetota bacterium]|nr:ubiquinone/menaquinone biosynthesis methyltransferase [Planctomycetota bacterium]